MSRCREYGATRIIRYSANIAPYTAAPVSLYVHTSILLPQSAGVRIRAGRSLDSKKSARVQR